MRGMIVLTLGLIVPILGTGCTAQPKRPTPVVTRVVYAPIPANLTDPLPVYERGSNTVGEYVKQAEANTAALKRANADRKATAAIQGAPE